MDNSNDNEAMKRGIHQTDGQAICTSSNGKTASSHPSGEEIHSEHHHVSSSTIRQMQTSNLLSESVTCDKEIRELPDSTDSSNSYFMDKHHLTLWSNMGARPKDKQGVITNRCDEDSPEVDHKEKIENWKKAGEALKKALNNCQVVGDMADSISSRNVSETSAVNNHITAQHTETPGSRLANRALELVRNKKHLTRDALWCNNNAKMPSIEQISSAKTKNPNSSLNKSAKCSCQVRNTKKDAVVPNSSSNDSLDACGPCVIHKNISTDRDISKRISKSSTDTLSRLKQSASWDTGKSKKDEEVLVTRATINLEPVNKPEQYKTDLDKASAISANRFKNKNYISTNPGSTCDISDSGACSDEESGIEGECWSEVTSLPIYDHQTKVTVQEDVPDLVSLSSSEDTDGEVPDLVSFDSSSEDEQENAPSHFSPLVFQEPVKYLSGEESANSVPDLISEDDSEEEDWTDVSSSSSNEAYADDEFECDCIHCLENNRHYSDSFHMMDEEYSYADEECEPAHNLFPWHFADSDPRLISLSSMFQAVILQMLMVHPDLLDQAPPPAPPTMVNELPSTTIEQAQVDPDISCPICLCPYEVKEEVSELPCQHQFHLLCVKAWLVKSGTCPVCRYILKGD